MRRDERLYIIFLQRRVRFSLLLSLSALLSVTLFSLLVGPTGILSLEDLLRGEPVAALRLSRTLGGLSAGVALGLGGFALQSVLRNPLVDPYVVGTSSGALLGSFVAALAGAPLGPLGNFIGGLLGALAALAATYAAGRISGFTTTGLVLSGVVVTILCSSLSAMLLLLHADKLRWGVAWYFGSLSLVARAHQLFILASGAAPLIALLAARLRWLKLYALGEEHARVAGVEPEKLRREVLLAVAWGAAAVSSTAGPIGFVGLMVPHIARLVSGGEVGATFLLTAALSPTLLLLGDIAARIVASPAELPVGVVTSVLGSLFFLYIFLSSIKRIGVRAR
ncbi:MAG: iron ABC transporter permease [Fervidicoccaceae archaeon]